MMTNKRYTIWSQLLLWLLIPIFLLLVLSIGSNYYLSRSFVNTAYDDGLEELARMLAGQVELESNGQFELASPALTKKIMDRHGIRGLYYLILGPQNEFIAGNKQFFMMNKPIRISRPKQHTRHYHNAWINGHAVRVVTIYMPFEKEKHPLWVSVQLAETLGDRHNLIGKILLTTIIHQFILILLAVACVWLGVTRGLQPLAQLSQAIKSRSPVDLNVLSLEKIPDEVQPLIAAINDLLMRMHTYLAMQRRFIANAAHQLRTPMAGLQTQVELLMRQALPESSQHTLNQIQLSLNHSTHLLHQLLALSRAEPDALKITQFKPVNMTKLVLQVSESFVPIALKKQIDFGVETQDDPITIQGDESSLHNLISNLIDNALLYTPPKGKVTVRLAANKSVTFSVEDSGCGIPVSEREKVFERFYRREPNKTPGSGLGLSIVQEIAQAHHAKIYLEEAVYHTGTLIQVEFE